MAKFISLFLTDRKFQVSIENILSSIHTQENGGSTYTSNTFYKLNLLKKHNVIQNTALELITGAFPY